MMLILLYNNTILLQITEKKSHSRLSSNIISYLKKMKLIVASVLLLVATVTASNSSDVDYDVVVYGSTPAGIAAATAAGVLGMKVALYEPLKMIGGMGAAGNLALNDGGNGAEHTGLALNFTLLNGKHYGVPGQVAHPESFVAEASFRTMLANANVKTISLDCRVTGATTAMSQGISKIQSASFFCEPKPITATVFIDASYDGDLMVAAGDIDYTAGREANTTYNESLAGARVPGFKDVGGPQHVDALYPNGTILKFVKNISELPPPGSADDALMAFQHRMCISGEESRVPWPKPDGYNPDDFLLLQRALDASNGNPSFFTRMPPSRLPGLPSNINKYCLCCGITIYASDQPNLNKGWANASWERRQEIIADHTYFELGSFYYLANDPRVNESVRNLYNQYGLCGDEFQEFGNIPPQLYIRISNRLVGDYVITQNNISNPRNKNDSIGVGDWSFDEHMAGKYAVPVGDGKYEVMLEGNFWPGNGWYDVSYRALVPKRGQGANLLVPVCISASMVAYTSTRIENMFMSLGSAAGVAAKQLVDGSVGTVQDVNVTEVQDILSNIFKQRVHGPPGSGPPPGPPPAKWYNVTGAGTAAWNGQYVPRSDGIFYNTNPNCAKSPNEPCALYSEGRTWRLAYHGVELEYVAGEESGSAPPLTGWQLANGSAPAPTLIAGPK
eukprot:m.46563 g.46563  ORF g.46563 m.46563 type:complete len:674 (+) comp10386_c0_seq2:163-2184(+)